MSCQCWLWENAEAQRESHKRYHPYAYVLHTVKVPQAVVEDRRGT